MTTTFEVALRQLVSSGESIVRLTVRDGERGLDVDPVETDLSIREARVLANMLYDVCELTEDERATAKATAHYVRYAGVLSKEETIDRAQAVQVALRGPHGEACSQGDALTIAMMIAIGAARQSGISAKEFGAFAEGWMAQGPSRKASCDDCGTTEGVIAFSPSAKGGRTCLGCERKRMGDIDQWSQRK